MDSLPPDPYLALGLAKDATAGAIKSTYRKLVLKCHPDKVQDESLKKEASDRFHLIQSAYEIVGDEDRRARYDAQCKLAELRKDVFGGGGGGSRGGVEVRTANYKMPTESARGGDFYARGPERYTRVSPQYEERRPSYVPEDYFDVPRANSRKYDEYERSAKRTSPREDKPKAKTSSRDAKETERSSRKEKSRRTDKDVRRDRERKTSYVAPDVVDDSEYDSSDRRPRRAREDEEFRREREAKDSYFDLSQRQREEAEGGAYADTRAHKLFRDMDSKLESVHEYIGRPARSDPERRDSPPERRPSPVRYSSSKDKLGTIRRGEGRPPLVSRRESGRPKTTGRDAVKPSREKEREPEYVEEVREPRRSETREAKRPPPLTTAKSAPENIRPSFERQRSKSVQVDHTEPAPPQVKRSETMPSTPGPTAPRESRSRREGSKLRPAEEAYATPELTPEPEVRSSRQRFGQHAYADDVEIPTVDGYKTEVRQPSNSRRYTRSPSPVKERERPRAASSKHAAAPQPPPLPRTTSVQYGFNKDNESFVRPSVSRGASERYLYGEVPTSSRSPAPVSRSSKPYTYSPDPETVRYRPTTRPEDYKVSDYNKNYNLNSGRDRKPERPSYNRESSGRQAVYAS